MLRHPIASHELFYSGAGTRYLVLEPRWTAEERISSNQMNSTSEHAEICAILGEFSVEMGSVVINIGVEKTAESKLGSPALPTWPLSLR